MNIVSWRRLIRREFTLSHLIPTCNCWSPSLWEWKYCFNISIQKPETVPWLEACLMPLSLCVVIWLHLPLYSNSLPAVHYEFMTNRSVVMHASLTEERSYACDILNYCHWECLYIFLLIATTLGVEGCCSCAIAYTIADLYPLKNVITCQRTVIGQLRLLVFSLASCWQWWKGSVICCFSLTHI